MAREIITLSLDPEMVKRVKAAAQIDGGISVSQMAAELFEAGLSRRGLLVCYETDKQRETEAPARVVLEAQRVWGNTPKLKGWVDFSWMSEDLSTIAQKLAEEKPRGAKYGMADWIAARLRDEGWTAQVVNDQAGDILEVWVHRPGDKCAECPKMARIREAMNAED